MENRGLFPEPRPFQEVAHQKLRDLIRAGKRKLVLAAPTGAGKTYLGMRICHEAVLRGRRALFVCDRKTLINQTSAVADGYGLSNHGVIMADHWRWYPHRPLQIASVQTLARRQWPEADVIVIDECHTMHKAWVDHVKETKAAVVGLSATPFSKGLGNVFDGVINAATMDSLVTSGVLKKLRVMTAHRPDLHGVKIRANGEYDENAVEEKSLVIAGHVVQEWLDHAGNGKTIMFGPTIRYVEYMVAKFAEAGVTACAFTCYTPDEERQKILDIYRRPDSSIRILISVDALAKGFDVQDVSCVIDAKPLRKSLSGAVQMWGRGLRQSPGIEQCLLLDHSGNVLRFAEDFERFYFRGVHDLNSAEDLDRKARKEPEDKPQASCPSCGYTPFVSACIACGYTRKLNSPVKVVDGKMRELDLIAAIKGKADLYFQISSWCKDQAVKHGLPMEKAKRRSLGIFRGMTGVWPSPGVIDMFDSVPPMACTKAVKDRIYAQLSAYAESQRNAPGKIAQT